ncbi:MAG: DedA family protein, partial [Candidatus Kapabacteria bacterium]|nr:DedA family protein [Candidatus Kapabacteria bacterium]
MIESIVGFLQTLPPWGVIAFVFLIAYVENLFPPSPSDVLLVFAGTLIGIGVAGYVPLLIASTLGGVTGFASAYLIGRRYGRQVVASPLVPFLDLALIDRVQVWFDRYHGLIIVVNRFLAGTRAVIAFAAGITHMPFPRTIVYCGISATAWNALLLWIGSLAGTRWREMDSYLSAYG